MTKGVDRNAAAAKMLKTLGQDTTLQGPMTNLPFLHDVIASDRKSSKARDGKSSSL